MIIHKDYGLISENEYRTIRLQLISSTPESSKWVSMVTYKNDKAVGCAGFSDEEAKILYGILYKHYHNCEDKNTNKSANKAIDILDDVKKKAEGISQNTVNSLSTLPTTDGNFKSILKDASIEEIEEAIKIMETNGGSNKSRIKTCTGALNRKKKEVEREKKKKSSTCGSYKPKPKELKYPTEKPKIIPFPVSQENHTFEECYQKLHLEREKYIEADSQYVIDGLIELCKVDQNLRNNVMRTDKTFAGFLEYMYEAAKNGYCMKYGNVGWLSRDLALGIATDYYNYDKKATDELRKKEKEEKDKLVKEKAKKEEEPVEDTDDGDSDTEAI